MYLTVSENRTQFTSENALFSKRKEHRSQHQNPAEIRAKRKAPNGKREARKMSNVSMTSLLTHELILYANLKIENVQNIYVECAINDLNMCGAKNY